MTLNTNWGKVLIFVYFLSFSYMSQLMSVRFPNYLFFIQMFCSSDCIEEELFKQ